MSEHVISAEAVSAAAAAIQVRLDRNIYLSDLARAALEAAAPYMVPDPCADDAERNPLKR